MPCSPQTLQLLERLVGFDTVSRNSNLRMIAFIEDWLKTHGVAATRVDFGPDKANLVAVIGPRVPGGLVLSGHTDVVPVDGQEWKSDPFRLAVRGHRAFGRGTADMKGFLACVLALVPRLARMRLRRPVVLAFSCDEEVGCTGVRPMLKWMRANLPPLAAVFVGEPTGMDVIHAHKGITVLNTRARGREAHASCTHLGANAIHAAARLVGEISQMAFEQAQQGPRQEGFQPPHATLTVGTISGGIAKNIIPRECVFEWEVRPLPGMSATPFIARLREVTRREVLPQLRACAPDAGVETTIVADVPGLEPKEDSLPVRLALSFAERNATARAAFATEAGLFARDGMPAVVCGPGHIAQAHRPDEYVELEQLAACERFLERLARWAAQETLS